MLNEQALMSNPQYHQLLARSSLGNLNPISGNSLAQGGQLLPRTYYSNNDPYASQSDLQYLQANAQVAMPADNFYPSAQPGAFLHPEHRDVRSQLLAGRSLGLSPVVNNAQAYQNFARPASPVHPSLQQQSLTHAAAAIHQAHLIQAQRAELASVLPRGRSHSSAELTLGGGNHQGSLKDYGKASYLIQEGLSGLSANGDPGRASSQFLEPGFSSSLALNGHIGSIGPVRHTETMEQYLLRRGHEELNSNPPEHRHKRPRTISEVGNIRMDSALNGGSPTNLNDHLSARGRRSGQFLSSPGDQNPRASRDPATRFSGREGTSQAGAKTNADRKERVIGSRKEKNIKSLEVQGSNRREEETEVIQHSNKASDFSSLAAADPSDSVGVDRKKEMRGDGAEELDEGPLAGMIFGCSSATFHECMRLRLFALPNKSTKEVLRVVPGTKLFLFNFDTKELSGIFKAVSQGGVWINPDAFRQFGMFPAQVQVDCVEMCPNLTMTQFKNAIEENFFNKNKFKFELNENQVEKLVELFRAEERLRGEQSVDRGRERPREFDYVPAQARDLILQDSLQHRLPFISSEQIREIRERDRALKLSRGGYTPWMYTRN